MRLHVTDRFILEMFYILLLKAKKKQKQYTKQLQFGSCTSVLVSKINLQYCNTASLHFKKEIALLNQDGGPSSPVPHLQILDLNIATEEARNSPQRERPAYNQDQKFIYFKSVCYLLTHLLIFCYLYNQLGLLNCDCLLFTCEVCQCKAPSATLALICDIGMEDYQTPRSQS